MPTLSAEQHDAVLNIMCQNDMDRKTILESLSTNHYDHITSTYYLLAQRIVGPLFFQSFSAHAWH